MPKKFNAKEITGAVRSFLEKTTGQRITSSRVDLVKRGAVSSLNMFELIDFIEKKYKVKVDLLAINPDNFNTLEKITKQIIIWVSP